MLKIKHFINGELVEPVSGAYLHNIDPAVGAGVAGCCAGARDDDHATFGHVRHVKLGSLAAIAPGEGLGKRRRSQGAGGGEENCELHRSGSLLVAEG